MSPEIHSVLIFGCIAVGLLVADRIYRINPYLSSLTEGFTSGSSSYLRCGVDLPPCAFPTRCMNGICGIPEIAQKHDRNPLPVLPQPPALLPGAQAPASTLPASWGLQLPTGRK